MNNHFPLLYSNLGEVTHGVPQESILGPVPFLSYINNLPQITNDNSKLILFSDDTSVIIANPDPLNFKNNLDKVTQDIIKWFETNLLSLNLDKTHYMQFLTKSSSPADFDIMHGNKKIAMVDNKKFLRLTLDSTLSWRTHIDSMAPN